MFIRIVIFFVLSFGVLSFTKNFQTRNAISLVEFNSKTSEKNKTVLVYFSASWCAICHKMKPVIEQLQQDYKTKLEFIFIDTDIDKEVADEFDANSLPLIVYYRNGVKQWSHVGKIEKPALKEKIGI